MVLVDAEASHWGHGQAGGELHAPDLDGIEEFAHCDLEICRYTAMNMQMVECML